MEGCETEAGAHYPGLSAQMIVELTMNSDQADIVAVFGLAVPLQWWRLAREATLLSCNDKDDRTLDWILQFLHYKDFLSCCIRLIKVPRANVTIALAL